MREAHLDAARDRCLEALQLYEKILDDLGQANIFPDFSIIERKKATSVKEKNMPIPLQAKSSANMK